MDLEPLDQFHYHCYRNNLDIKSFMPSPYYVNSQVDSRFGEDFAGYTPLHFAVKHKNEEAVIYLLKQRADITKQSDNSWTPVHLAYYNSYYELVETIFRHSAVKTSVNAVDTTGLTHFHICCALYSPIIHKFITRGEDMNRSVSLRAKENSGFTPLHFAVKHKNKLALIDLLEQGADITKQSADSWTPVHLAYYTKNNDLVRRIFENASVNASVNAVDNTGLSHFHICCALNLPIIETFIKSGTKVNCSVSLLADNNGGFTPLHFAVQNGHSSAARLLLANGANLRMKCGRGFTPLHVACEHPDSSIIELLLTNDEDLRTLTTKDNEGLIPLHVACKNSDFSVVELFLTFDADLNTLKANDNRGRTALHYAAEQGCTSIVELLMEKGASINEPSYENETPIDVAVKRKRYDVFELMSSKSNLENEASVISFSAAFSLDDFHDACRRGNLNDIAIFLKHGFPVDSHAHSMVAKKYFGHTPLHFAVENQSEDIVLYLLQSGADITEKNDHGCTPVHLAYRKKFVRLIVVMFEHSKVNTFVNVADLRGLTHFHICCTLSVEGNVEGFLLSGADINCSTSLLSAKNAGFTPLHFAIEKGFASIVELLLKNGANHSLADKNGLTPLHLACDLNSVFNAELLVTHGADIVAKDSKNRLPLHCVFYKAPDSSLVTFLLGKMPTDHNYADSQRLSILHMACFNCRSEIVKKLLDQGCSPNSRVMLITENIDLKFADGTLHSGVTPLHVALYAADEKSARHLILAGADVNALDEEGYSTLSYIYGSCRRVKQRVFRLGDDMLELYVLIDNHIKKLETAGLYVSERVTEQLEFREINDFQQHRLREKFVNNRVCTIELEEMQRRRVTERANNVELNLRSILGKSETEMYGLVRNEEVAAFLNPARLDFLAEEFPLYGFLVKAQVNRGLRKLAMIRNAKASLKRLTGFNFPDLCAELIFNYLRTDHLENLIDANIRQ